MVHDDDRQTEAFTVDQIADLKRAVKAAGQDVDNKRKDLANAVATQRKAITALDKYLEDLIKPMPLLEGIASVHTPARPAKAAAGPIETDLEKVLEAEAEADAEATSPPKKKRAPKGKKTEAPGLGFPDAAERDALLEQPEGDELLDDLTHEQSALMDDPNVNGHGCYTHYEEIVIPMTKSWRCGVTIKLAKGLDGKYRCGHEFKQNDMSGYGCLPHVKMVGHKTANEALQAKCLEAVKYFDQFKPQDNGAKKAASAVLKYQGELMAQDPGLPVEKIGK